MYERWKNVSMDFTRETDAVIGPLPPERPARLRTAIRDMRGPILDNTTQAVRR